jgi:polyisoprenoid-binding protein YceI
VRRRRLVAIAFAALLVFGIAGGYAYLTLKDRNAPPPLTLSGSATGQQGAVPDGAWVIRRPESVVGFRAREKYLSLPVPSEVVGRTSVVRGTMETRGGAIVATNVVVDMRTLKTNDSRRDDTLRSSREPLWDEHPEGRFTLAQPVRLDGLRSEPVAKVVARGTLRIHDVDRRVAFPLQVRLSGERFQAAGLLRTTMTSFGFDPPSVAGLTTVRNGVTLEVKLTFVRS